MEQEQLLQSNSVFADHMVVGKLSLHHDGEREVYMATDGESRNVALTVFDIKCRRYATDRSARKRQPDFLRRRGFIKHVSGYRIYGCLGTSEVSGLRHRHL